MISRTNFRIQAVLAAVAGLTLRLFFILKFPVTQSGDAPFYIELAWNWLKHGVYGFPVHGQLTPVDMRVPGYPAFLAGVFAFAGQSPRAAMIAQAAVDVATCFVIALIAARLAPSNARRRVALAGLWMAALCPLTANYSAVVLTEVLVIFLTALATLVLLETDLGAGVGAGDSAWQRAGGRLNAWFVAGIVVGFGTLVRPETPLLLFAAGLALLGRWWRPRDWKKLARAGLLMGAGLLLPLLPWAARNWTTLHDVQFLAPRYSELPGEYTPLGFNAWTNTWLWRFRDVYLTQWNVNDTQIEIDSLPSYAFDSPQERARVAQLLDAYNDSLTMDPPLDDGFREIAKERTRRDPLRTYVKIPLLRSLTLWFTPRLELLPYSGKLVPMATEWSDDRPDFLTTIGLIAANAFYVGMALWGVWIARRRPGWALLVIYIVVRTAFFTHIETIEPRYVLECFPAVIALGAQAFARRESATADAQLSSTGSG
ncbi:MAG: glycosyltransferase family 39 protein [Candidatus Acidiferrales bacterium]